MPVHAAENGVDIHTEASSLHVSRVKKWASVLLRPWRKTSIAVLAGGFQRNPQREAGGRKDTVEMLTLAAANSMLRGR
jgi:hypothetical protein